MFAPKLPKNKGFFRRVSLPTENTFNIDNVFSNCDLRRFGISVQSSSRWILPELLSLAHVLIVSSQIAVESHVACVAENVRSAGEGCVTETNSS